MTPQAILADLLVGGIVPSLTPDGRGIALPAGRLNPAQRAAIVANKAALVAHLTCAITALAPAPAPAPAPHGADAVPAPAPAPAPARPMLWCDVGQPWRAADRLYEQHHWQCTTCRAAARGHAPRCPEGQRLHDAYTLASSATLNERTSP